MGIYGGIDTGQRTFNRLFDGERISGWRVRNGAFAESYLPWIGFCRKFFLILEDFYNHFISKQF